MANETLDGQARKRVGEILVGYVDAGILQIEDAKEWWNFVRSVHRDENRSDTRDKDDNGIRVFHVPVSSTFQDTLVAQICSVVCKQDPLVIDSGDESKLADDKAALVTRIWKKAKFSKRFKKAVTIATDTDLAFIRQCSMGAGTGLVELSVHGPEDVIVYPAIEDNFTIMGHRVWKRRRDITLGKDAKDYYSDNSESGLPSSDSPLNEETQADEAERAGITQVSGPLEDLDALVELWDVVVQLDLGPLKRGDEHSVTEDQAWYRATISRTDRELLALEKYPYVRPWYFAFRLKGSADYYPATSIGRNLWPIQDAYNNLFSAMYAGASMAAMPPILSPAAIEKDGQKYEQYQAGDVLELDGGGGAPWSPAVSPQLAPIPVMLQALLQLAYRTTGISENTSGGSPAGQTATAASITASGVAVKLEDYIENVTEELPEMASHLLEIVLDDFAAFAKRYNVVPPAPDEQEATPGVAPQMPPPVPGMLPPPPGAPQ